MDYVVDLQVGYYEDDDTYHGPFKCGTKIEAESLNDAVREAQQILQREMRKFNEPENMTDGTILTIHDQMGRLLYSYPLGILAQEVDRAITNEQAKANVINRLKSDPKLGQRAWAALRAAGLEAVKAFLGPAASIIIAAIEAWNSVDNPDHEGKN